MKKIYKLSVLSALFLTGTLNAALEPRCASPILMFQEADQQDDVAERFFSTIRLGTATSKTLEDFLAHTWTKPFLEGDRFNNSETLLTKAICFHRSLVPFLLTHGANPNKPNGFKQYPLKIAVSSLHLTIVKLLLNHGASLKAPTSTVLLETALLGNINNRSPEVSEQIIALLLAKKPSLDQVEAGKEPFLLFAIKQNARKQVLRMVLDRNPNLEVKDSQNRTPLLVAVMQCLQMLAYRDYHRNPSEKLTIIDMLLQAKANVNAQDAQGMTALHHCASGSATYDDIAFPQILKLVKKLLATGADWQMQDNKGLTFVEQVPENARPAFLEAVRFEKERRAAAQAQRNERCAAFLRSKGSYLAQFYKLSL